MCGAKNDALDAFDNAPFNYSEVIFMKPAL